MYTLVLFSSDLCDNGLYFAGKQVVDITTLLKKYTYNYLLGCTQKQLARIAEAE